MVSACLPQPSGLFTSSYGIAARRIRFRTPPHRFLLGTIGVFLLLAGCQVVPSLPLAGDPFAPTERPRLEVGDTYVYQFSDGYGSLQGGKVSYRVDEISADRVAMSVTPDVRREGTARAEIYTSDGNWLRHPLNNHDERGDYEFAPAFPAYVFPLAPGKSWVMRIKATSAATGSRSIRVEGKVLRAERIRVPAGEFDTIKIRRYIYAGDMDYRGETYIIQTDWYAPELGRAVRSESQAEWYRYRPCNNGPICDPTAAGDWDVYQLVFLPSRAR